MLGLDDQQVFYLVIFLFAIPVLLIAIKFGSFMVLPRFILKRYFMHDYNKEREKVAKRKEKEERKRMRRK